MSAEFIRLTVGIRRYDRMYLMVLNKQQQHCLIDPLNFLLRQPRRHEPVLVAIRLTLVDGKIGCLIALFLG
jgi:hypothetical protein